jgi:hypothetical protein
MSKTLAESAAEILKASMSASGKEPAATMSPEVVDLGGSTNDNPAGLSTGAASSAKMKMAAKPGAPGVPAEGTKKMASEESEESEEDVLFEEDEIELTEEEIDEYLDSLTEEELEEMIAEEELNEISKNKIGQALKKADAKKDDAYDAGEPETGYAYHQQAMRIQAAANRAGKGSLSLAKQRKMTEEEALEEQAPMYQVRNTATGRVVGTHSYGQGFKPSASSGLKPHPTSIPDGHEIDKSKNLREQEEEIDEAAERAAYKADIVTKYRGSMKEDVDALFNGESLSEDFRVKATLIFEAAVQSRVEAIVEEVLDENDAVLEEAIQNVQAELSEQVDDYLNYVVEEWVDENQVAIETGLRAELVEDFIGGLKNLFAEHYIDIPDEKVDVAEALAAQVADLQQEAEETDDVLATLVEELGSIKKEKAVARICEGLTQVQAEKMKSLAEGVEFTAEGDFDNKLAVIRENYFPSKVSVKSEVKTLQETSVEEPEVAEVPSYMRHYVNAISKTAPSA